MSWRLVKNDEFGLWHGRLGHLSATIICRIIVNTRGHPLKNTKVLLSKDYSCETCSQEKLIIMPSLNKVDLESPSFFKEFKGVFVAQYTIKWSISIFYGISGCILQMVP